MSQSRVDRVIERWVAHRLRGDAQAGVGRLVYVDSNGGVHALGSFALRDLEGIASAVDIARRTSHLSSEKARLSRYSYAASRLASAARRVRQAQG